MLTTVHLLQGSVDCYLNVDKYIVPGLGDYGDRYGHKTVGIKASSKLALTKRNTLLAI
jgi:hypothetical protein